MNDRSRTYRRLLTDNAIAARVKNTLKLLAIMKMEDINVSTKVIKLAQYMTINLE